MRWMLLNPLRTLPPLGLLAVGAVVGTIGVPVIKKNARKAAVWAVQGALEVGDTVKEAGHSLNNLWQERVEKARSEEAAEESKIQAMAVEPTDKGDSESINENAEPVFDNSNEELTASVKNIIETSKQ
jgi:precorrin-6B methylase 2